MNLLQDELNIYILDHPATAYNIIKWFEKFGTRGVPSFLTKWPLKSVI